MGKTFGRRRKRTVRLTKDKYGVSLQIVPSIFGEMLHDQDAGKAYRVMKAMLQMAKIELITFKEGIRSILNTIVLILVRY